jgi:hypothetical protein
MAPKTRYGKQNRSLSIQNGSNPNAINMAVSGFVPVGGIIAWIGGYFQNSSNGTYTPVLAGNTVAEANKYLNKLGYYVCDGTALNDPESPIWNSATSYLPDLSDGRFLHGSLSVGSGGSAVVLDHTHGITGFSLAADTTHTHDWPIKQAGGYFGNWSISDATLVSSDNGNGSGNTYSDGNGADTGWWDGGYWGTGGGTSMYAERRTSTQAAFTHKHELVCAANTGGPGLRADYNGEGPSSVSYQYGPNIMDAVGTTNPDHQHSSYLPNHRHYIANGNTSTETAHIHTFTGSAGSGSAPLSTNNEPLYINCLFVVRVK